VAGEKAAFSFLDLIYGLKGHSAVVVRVDPEKTLHTPGPLPIEVPAFSLLICVDGVGPVVEQALTPSPAFKRSVAGTAHVFELAQPLPVPGIQPVFVADGTTLYIATTKAFLDECRSLKSGLADTAEFKHAIEGVGAEGNGLTYVSPKLFDQFRRLETLNPKLPPQVKSPLAMLVGKAPKIDRPMVAIRTNLPDGILVRAYWDRSFKQELAMTAVYNPLTIGVLSAMAIPAFQKVRSSSQEKAVVNNLRQLSSAADQFYLENGVTSATFDDLVGPGKFIPQLISVVGEDYRQLEFKQGEPLRLTLPDGRVIQWPKD
jgi:hypothetical protein